MRLPAKLSILLAGAATLPALLVAGVTLPASRDALRAQLEQLYAQSAQGLASAAHHSVIDRLDGLTLATSGVDFGRLDPARRDATLAAIWSQTRGSDVAGLFDAHGDPVGELVHREQFEGELAQMHEPAGAREVAAYARNVPLQAALDAGIAIGPPYTLPDAKGDRVPHVVLAATVPGPAGARWVVAVGISLRSLASTIDGFGPGEKGAAFLLDGHGRTLVPPRPASGLFPDQLALHPVTRGEPASDWLGASATVPLLGWRVVLVEPAAEALRPLQRLQLHGLAWMLAGALAAMTIGAFASRGLLGRLRALREATEAVAAGAVETELEVLRDDESGELAFAFNRMTRGLREREGLRMMLGLSELQLDEVLQRLLESLDRVVRFEDAAALLRARDGLVVAAARGPRARERNQSYLTTAPHVQRALASHKPALNDGRQMLAIPLVQRGTVVCVVSLESQEPYDAAAVALAASLVQPAALAVENARLHEEVERLTTLDAQTATHNRRHLLELAQVQFDSVLRFGQPLSALILEVDGFDRVHDQFGPAVGDQVLRGIADRCRATLRSIDLLGRYGPEQFAILLPGTTSQNAATILAERIRHRVAADPVPTDSGPVRATVSLGVAGLESGTPDPGALLKRAEDALAAARKAGRNRVSEAGGQG